MPEEVLETVTGDLSLAPIDALDAALAGAGHVDVLTERRARQDLRRQIALLERRLGELFASAFPRQPRVGEGHSG